jgi:hypothetical protein
MMHAFVSWLVFIHKSTDLNRCLPFYNFSDTFTVQIGLGVKKDDVAEHMYMMQHK